MPDGMNVGSERCNTLVAAGLDQCMPCQTRLIGELSEPLTDDFETVFIAWVTIAFNRHALRDPRTPDTAAMLFSLACRAEFSPHTRKALGSVTLRQDDSTAEEWVTDTVAALRAALLPMKPDERRAVLDDAMDGIIGAIITHSGIY
ncbi:hypothetical protein [Streptomyces sp. MBT27]|uniref:hypothetical protein n=1 Tax=Streptomyces sp. MBT27 TaxID=1488356 RepID=UPI00141E8686|nr:hypothetical protein [Streptomyces sp. MBT27]